MRGDSLTIVNGFLIPVEPERKQVGCDTEVIVNPFENDRCKFQKWIEDEGN